MHCDRSATHAAPIDGGRRQLSRPVGLALLALTALLSGGCISLAGDHLEDIQPVKAGIAPSIEETVGDFSFHLDGGKMITSVKAGRNLNNEILKRWKSEGWISDHEYVKDSKFTGRAGYNLTLGGHQEGDSNVALQVISGITLMLVPYSVNTKMDLHYRLEHVPSGRVFEAEAADSYRTVSSIVLLPVTVFAMGGIMRTYDRLAFHLYDQFAKQGAFDPDSWTPTEAQTSKEIGTAADRLRDLKNLRDSGLVSQEEYERKKQEILEGL